MALDNDTLPEDHTLNETKSFDPPYLQKYFGLALDGTPIPSKAIKAKSEATINTAKAYQHPMFVLSDETEKAIDAFVDDAIAKYEANRCGG